MITKEQILLELNSMLSEENSERINGLISKVQSMEEKDLEKVLKERKIKTIEDVKEFALGSKQEEQTPKFTPLNNLVSFGIKGKTIHIHVVPEDAHDLLTKEGLRQAKLALVDAVEQIKEKMKTDKNFQNLENVYAVSGIVTGVVARWFKELGFDVKTLPIDEAKKDGELKHFYKMFKDQKKLGRAILGKEKLMSEEWETAKNAIREASGSPVKNNKFIESLQTLNSTDAEVLKASESIENKEHPVVEKKIVNDVIE